MKIYKSFRLQITFLICFYSVFTNAQTDWVRSDQNPVLVPGGNGTWDETFAVVNTVLYHEGIYKMWYEGDNGFGYATSLDGINWTKDSLNNPILQPGPVAAWDEREINNASVLFIDNIYHMWYSGVDFFYDNRIGYATSPDGINWTKDSLNPVLDHGNPGSWDDEEVLHPFVIGENDTLKMYYNGHDGQTQRILLATSIDGKNWNKYSSHPMMVPGIGITWDNNELGPLTVVHHENLYHMWYTGWNHTDYIQIGYATSLNGLDWVKDSVVLGHGEIGEWDDGAVALPFVLFEQDTFKMWYGGTDGILFQTGYATSDLIVNVEEVENTLSLQYVLNQNYPNPFNPSTNIKFRIADFGFTSLKVYDVLGNEVATLANEDKPAGEYKIEFNAENLSSGIYFYQLKAGNFVQTKKMILIK